MVYQFKCPECGQQRFIDIKISDYDNEKHNQKCTNCNSYMQRVLEWSGPATNLGGYSDVAGTARWQS